MKSKRKRIVHVCAACKAEFKKRSECWWHMDNACPVRLAKKSAEVDTKQNFDEN